MKWQNKVQLVGYLGKDPLIQIMSTGHYRATLFLATNNGYQKENKKRITYWHRIAVWGKKHDYLRSQFTKGSHVMVDGSLTYRTFEDSNGITRQLTEIHASKLVNLDR